MKKFYSLFAIAAFGSMVFAQGTENFEAQTVLTSTYADGSFSGQTAGVTVNFVHSRNEGLSTSDDYSISGKGIMLRRADESSSVEFTIPNGVGTFTFKYRKAFTGGNERKLSVQVDGAEVATSTAFGAGSGADATVYTMNTVINKSGVVKVKITYPNGTPAGNRQVTIDDVSWTANTMGVVDASSIKAGLVKNTFVKENLSFGVAGKTNVQIFNMNGQEVSSAVVDGNTELNVSFLPKGAYIVTAVVDGEKVSQKIIKK